MMGMVSGAARRNGVRRGRAGGGLCVGGLLWSFGMAVSGAAAQEHDGWFREIPAGRIVYDEAALVAAHMPTFLQWVVATKEDRHLDFMVPIDYDEVRSDSLPTWDTTNNWEHANQLRREAAHVMYAGVVAVTANQIYLVYYFYHARDHKELLPHENDLEGGMLVYDRQCKRIIHAHALAHGHFDERYYCSAANVKRRDAGRYVWRRDPSRRGGRRRFWEMEKVSCDQVLLENLIVAVEGEGHGARLGSSKDLESVGKQRGTQEFWLKYEHDAASHRAAYNAQEEVRNGRWQEARTTRIRLKPIWPLFAGMFDEQGTRRRESRLYAKPVEPSQLDIRGYDGHEPKVGFYRALRGDSPWWSFRWGTDRAHFPWGQGNELERFFDPVYTIIRLEDGGTTHLHSAVACDYQFNPYLQTLFDGRLPEDLEFVRRRDGDFYEARCGI